MEKIKNFFKSIGGYIIGALTLAVGILLWVLSNKKKEVNALKAKIELAETQKQVDLIEVEIKQRLDNKNLLAKEVQELNNNLAAIDEKRKQLAQEEKDKPADAVEDFWKKN